MGVVPLDRMGGIVLCGGQSTRMGRPKLCLPFGGEAMLARVVRIVGEVVSPVVVVAARGQNLPELPMGTLIAWDQVENQGPLGGLAAGMTALQDLAEAVFASSCDVPLLRPEFIRVMAQALGTHELALPRDGEHLYPLAAVYRTSLDGRIKESLAAGRLRAALLAQESNACFVDVCHLRSVDSNLSSLRNTNTPEEYRGALIAAGLPADNDGIS